MIEHKLGIQCESCKNHMIVSSKEKGKSILCPKCNFSCYIPEQEAIPAEYNEEYNTKNQTLVNDFFSICPNCHNHYRLPRSMHQQEMLCYYCHTIFIPSIITQEIDKENIVTKEKSEENNKKDNISHAPHTLYEKIRNSKIGHKLHGGLALCLDIEKINKNSDKINWIYYDSSKEKFSNEEMSVVISSRSNPKLNFDNTNNGSVFRSDFCKFGGKTPIVNTAPVKTYCTGKSFAYLHWMSDYDFDSNAKPLSFIMPSPSIISFFILWSIYIANSDSYNNSRSTIVYLLKNCSNIKLYIIGYLILYLSFALYDGKLAFFRNSFRHLESTSDLCVCFSNSSYLKLELIKTTYIYALILLLTIPIKLYNYPLTMITLGTCIIFLTCSFSIFSIYYLMDNIYENELQCIKQSIQDMKDNIFYFIGTFAIITLKSFLIVILIGIVFHYFKSIHLLFIICLGIPIFFIKLAKWLWQINTLPPIFYEIIKD